MKIENGRIKEATKSELLSLYLYYEVDDVMPFDEYLEHMRKNGIVILK